jgi:hypothetical protein
MTSSYPIIDATHDDIRIDIIVRRVDETNPIYPPSSSSSFFSLQVDFERRKEEVTCNDCLMGVFIFCAERLHVINSISFFIIFYA